MLLQSVCDRVASVKRPFALEVFFRREPCDDELGTVLTAALAFCSAEHPVGTVVKEEMPTDMGESHLRRTLSAYAVYYNQMRTHLALQKDAPLHRAVQRSGVLVAIPILAGLHHQYVRI
jgi:hypothetical protein